MEKNADIIISQTARQSGYGTDRYKYVAYLQSCERMAAREGKDVYYLADRPDGGNHGSYWRKVRCYWASGRYRYVPLAVRDAEVLKALDATL